MTAWLQRAVYALLKPRGRKTLREVVVTMCAGDPKVLTQVRLQRVILRTENFVAELPFIYFVGFKLALFLLNFALPPLAWKLRPFTWMPLDERLRYLDKWQASNFYYKRMLFKMVQAVCVSHLYSEERLLVSLGFEKSMIHRRQRAPEGPQ